MFEFLTVSVVGIRFLLSRAYFTIDSLIQIYLRRVQSFRVTHRDDCSRGSPPPRGRAVYCEANEKFNRTRRMIDVR